MPIAITAIALSSFGCNQNFNVSKSTIAAVNSSQSNVVPITVGCGYTNEPCVSVTVCTPGTSTCQTVPNVLLDTGSYGLRLFSQVSLDGFKTVTSLVSLPTTSDPNKSGNTLAECVSYGDGSSDWGPLATADVVLGGEKASSVPIQIINSSYATLPASCSSPDGSPIGTSGTGFNGIIGVGLFTADCGTACAGLSSNGIYYTCTAAGVCTGASVALSLQTTNPVTYFSTDNNGVILQLPSVPINFGTSDGTGSVSGYLILGIGTEANNTPATTNTFAADSNGNFSTVFNGKTYSNSLIDSGTNVLYFPGPTSLPTCTSNTSFYCPTSEVTFTATQKSSTNSIANVVTFYIGNADDEFSTSNSNINFADIGASITGDFVWGLPFFYGRTVVVGISGKTSSLGTGPLWSY